MNLTRYGIFGQADVEGPFVDAEIAEDRIKWLEAEREGWHTTATKRLAEWLKLEDRIKELEARVEMLTKEADGADELADAICECKASSGVSSLRLDAALTAYREAQSDA